MIRLPLLIILISFLCSTVQAYSGEKNMTTAQEIIEKLNLQPLPEEGGYYRQTYRSLVSLPSTELGIDGQGERLLGTAIYYLVTPESFSALHRLRSDEIFHFYSGDPVEMIQIGPDGKLRIYTIGSNIVANETPQVVVPAGTWQGLRLKRGGAWALLGTTMSPGFEFEDFELGKREDMLNLFPGFKNEVLNYSRADGERAH